MPILGSLESSADLGGLELAAVMVCERKIPIVTVI